MPAVVVVPTYHESANISTMLDRLVAVTANDPGRAHPAYGDLVHLLRR